MCGILGFTGKPQRLVLNEMAQTLIHRGPDDQGFIELDNITLGMRRLSIVDLESGQQPCSNETEDIWVVFNGEIYNHIELRKMLESKGHKFRSNHSDTEVIPHLYEEFGLDFLHKLNGMFAIALFDKKQNKLVLARDQAGIKPLFFTIQKDEIIFGSEIKALLKHPYVQKRPNFNALHHYLTLKNTPAPETAFEGIYQLKAGELAVYKNKKFEVSRWWRINFQEDQNLDEETASFEIRKTLEDSVRLQMRSDVDVGAYLSGGIDSSSVAAIASKLSSKKLKTFTLVFEEDFKNKTADREFAKIISEQYDTDHHEHVMSHRQIANSIKQVINAFDEPFSGVTSTYFLTKVIGQHVKVALSGDGADELFGSYAGPRSASPLWYLEHHLNSHKNFDHIDLNRIAPYEKNLEYLKSILTLGDEADRRMAYYVWQDIDKNRLYSNQMKDLVSSSEQSVDLIRQLYKESSTNDPINRALFVDFESLLPDQVLPFVDRLSMAHSVEVRPPYLDIRLIELAAKIPGKMKIKNGQIKWILKKALHGLLPESLLHRPKEGFVLPVNDWLKGDLGLFARKMLTHDRLAKHGLFNSDEVDLLFCKISENPTQIGGKIWSLVMLQAWWENFFD